MHNRSQVVQFVHGLLPSSNGSNPPDNGSGSSTFGALIPVMASRPTVQMLQPFSARPIEPMALQPDPPEVNGPPRTV